MCFWIPELTYAKYLSVEMLVYDTDISQLFFSLGPRSSSQNLFSDQFGLLYHCNYNLNINLNLSKASLVQFDH